MRTLHPQRAAVLAAALTTLIAAAPAAADDPPATANPPAAAGTTRLAEYAGHTVSTYDGTSVFSQPEADGFHLMRSDDGAAPVEVPVAPQPLPFDIDLGTGANGRLAAVMSVCQTIGGAQPRGGTCDVETLDLATGTTKRVPAASQPGVDETAPTIWEGTIAFARRRESSTASLRLVGTKGRVKTITIDGSSHHFEAVHSIDLGDRGLAVSGMATDRPTPGAEELWFKPVNRSPRRIAKWGYGEEHSPRFSVSLAGDRLWVGAVNAADTSNGDGAIVAYDLGEDSAEGAATQSELTSVAADAAHPDAAVLFATGRTYAASSANQVARLDDLELLPLKGELARAFRPR